MIEPGHSGANLPSDSLGREFALTLARGIAVLEAFGPDQPSLTTAEAAARIGISRGAARRLLLTLTQLGYLHQEGSRFALTDKILSIGHGVLAREGKWQWVTSDVFELAHQLNEPCSIAVLVGLDIEFVVRDQTRRIFSMPLNVGDRLPAHCSSAGKVLLAALDHDELNRRLDQGGPLAACTEKSITDPERLRAELHEVRLAGWASAENEMELGTIAIAVPLFGQRHQVLAALVASSHTMRRTMAELRSDFLPAIQHAAERISDKLSAGTR